MTHGYAGQHLLLHVDSGVGHSATEAGGAEATALAGESYELRVPQLRQSCMGVRRVSHSKAPWLDACRRWSSAISGKWA
mgnify:CR=1 FL=1